LQPVKFILGAKPVGLHNFVPKINSEPSDMYCQKQHLKTVG